MDLITIDRGGGDILFQGAIRIVWPGKAAPEQDLQRFIQILHATMRSSMAVPFTSRSVALDIAPGRETATEYAWTCRPQDVPRLRMVLAALVRLAPTSGAEIVLPENAADFETGFLQPDLDRFTLDTAPQQTTGGGEVAQSLRLFDLIGEFVLAAITMDLGLRLECAIVAERPAPDAIRAVRYRNEHLHRQTAAPADLVQDQRAMADRLAKANYHCVEAIIPGPGSADMVRDVTDGALQAPPYGRIGMRGRLQRADPDTAQALGFLTHPALMADEASAPYPFDPSGFLTTQDVTQRLGLSRLCERMDIEIADPDPNRASAIETVLALQTPVEQQSPFLFLSYARKDWAKVEPILNALTQRKVNLWVDTDIHGGDVWLEELETQIVQSAGVLAVVSDAYMQSRYCLGEVRFAMTLGKPFIPVRLDSSDLRGGLALMFSSYQFIPRDHGQFFEQLMRAVEEHVSSTITDATGPAFSG